MFFSQENLQFWEAIEAFKEPTKTVDTELIEKAVAIFEQFVKPLSEKEINISDAVKQELVKRLSNKDTLKEKVNRHIFNLAQGNLFPI